MDSNKQFIPNRLRKYRKQTGYTQVEVAVLVGLKCGNRISEWENGISKPSIDNLIKLSVLYQTLCCELYPDIRKEFVGELAKRKGQKNNGLYKRRDMYG